jgi:hypothetical protein
MLGHAIPYEIIILTRIISIIRSAGMGWGMNGGVETFAAESSQAQIELMPSSQNWKAVSNARFASCRPYFGFIRYTWRLIEAESK